MGLKDESAAWQASVLSITTKPLGQTILIHRIFPHSMRVFDNFEGVSTLEVERASARARRLGLLFGSK